MVKFLKDVVDKPIIAPLKEHSYDGESAPPPP